MATTVAALSSKPARSLLPALPTSAKPTVPLIQQGSPFNPPTSLLHSTGLLAGDFSTTADRKALLVALDYSLRYLQTTCAIADYRNSRTPGITRERVRRSLQRFRQLLLTVASSTTLQAAIERKFIFYQATGIPLRPISPKEI